MQHAAVPLRVIDYVFDRVLGIPDSNVEVAAGWSSRRNGASGGHDPLRSEQGAVAFCDLGADGTATRIGTKTGLEQRWRKEGSARHHQCCDRERASTHDILRAVTTEGTDNARGVAEPYRSV